MNGHRHRGKRHIETGLWAIGLTVGLSGWITAQTRTSAGGHTPEKTETVRTADDYLRRADRLSLYYAEELYRDPSLTDSFAMVREDLRKAFAKPDRLDSLAAAWQTALTVLERMPETADWEPTAEYLVQKVTGRRPAWTVSARLSVWALQYDKGLISETAYRTFLRTALETAGGTEAENRARLLSALARTYRYTAPDTAHLYAEQAIGLAEAGSAQAAELQLFLKSIEAPFCSVGGLNVYEPGHPMLWSVCVKNIRRLPYRILAVPAGERMNLLSGMMPLERYAADKTACAEGVWTLDLFPKDYREHRTEVSLPPLPAGVYVLEVDRRLFLPFQVSGLALIDMGTAGFSVKRGDGRPARDVTAEIWTAEYDYMTHLNRYERLGGGTSDGDGFIDLDIDGGDGTEDGTEDGTGNGGDGTAGHGDRVGKQAARADTRAERRRLNRFYLFHHGNDSLIRTFVQPPLARQEAGAAPNGMDTLVGLRFFTDLPIYKAGDSLRFKGVAWGRKTGPGATFPLAGRKLNLYLIAPDPLGRRARLAPDTRIPPLSVETDSMGGFSGGFRLPDEAAAGLWQLQADLPGAPGPRRRRNDTTALAPTGRCYIANGHQHYIRVEAYRPPQFEMQLADRDSAVWGQAKTLNGRPLGGAVVRIEIRMNPAGRYLSGSEETSWQTALLTDADGCFLLPTALFSHLEATLSDDADDPQESRAWGGGYSLTCTVTDLNGEMQSATLWLPLRGQAYRALWLSPENRLAETDGRPAGQPAGADTFKLFVLNPMGERRIADYDLTVDRLYDTLPDRAFDRRFPEPDGFLLSRDTFLRDFPCEPYATRAQRQAATVRQTVYTHTGRDTALVLSLPDGRYAYRVDIRHPLVPGRTDRAEGTFSLGRQPLVPSLYADVCGDSLHLTWVQPDARAAETADSLISIYYSVEARGGKRMQARLEMRTDGGWRTDRGLRPDGNRESRTVLPLTAFHAGDDLRILLAYVCGQRIFRQTLYRPGQPDEAALDIAIGHLPEQAHTRTPDTLRLQVRRGGRGQAVPLTLALYDDALHALTPECWFAGDGHTPPALVPPPAPAPFLRHFPYDPLLFSQEVAYTSPDAYRFDQNSARRGARMTYAPAAKAALATEIGAGSEEAAADATAASTATASGLPEPRGEQPASVLFFPTLWSDDDGQLQLPFQLPAAPGRYRWEILTYDRDLQAAYATETTRTFQDYQLSWQLPPFLYAGDSVRFLAKASRRETGAAQTALVTWEIADRRFESRLEWPAGQADLKLTAPVTYSPADSDGFSVRLCLRIDGETAASPAKDALTAHIPVLSDRIYLQTAIPFHIRPGERLTVKLPKTLTDALRQSPTVDTLFFQAVNPAERIALLCRDLTLDTADHAWNALLHYLKNRLIPAGDGGETNGRQAAKSDSPAETAYRRLCRFLTPDNGFCWIEGQPTDPVISLFIAEALAANAGDEIAVHTLLKRDLLPYLERTPSEATRRQASGTSPADSLPTPARLRLLYTETLVYGRHAGYQSAHYQSDLQAFAAHIDRYPIKDGVYGLYALYLHGDTALFDQSWRHYRRQAIDGPDGLYWKSQEMGLNTGERLKTASLVYRLLHSRNDWTETAAVYRWISRQQRTTDLLSPAAAVRPMDVLTLAYDERLFPLPTPPQTGPIEWRLRGRQLVIDWPGNDKGTTAHDGADSIAALFGTYGALTFGYTQKLSAVTSQASDLRVTLLCPPRIPQGSTPVLQLRIESKHPASYVQVRFGRPAGGEYARTRAGFVYRRGLSFYENIGKTQTELLIPFLPAGRYLLSYPLNAQTPGAFTLPPATIEILLDAADSFAGHSRGAVVRIQEE